MRDNGSWVPYAAFKHCKTAVKPKCSWSRAKSQKKLSTRLKMFPAIRKKPLFMDSLPDALQYAEGGAQLFFCPVRATMYDMSVYRRYEYTVDDLKCVCVCVCVCVGDMSTL